MIPLKKVAIYMALASPYIFIAVYLILGSITPGYSHFAHTISRLSIGKYGLLQSLNIMQFSLGLCMMIYLVRHTIKSSETIREISIMLGTAAITLALLAIFPTDPIDSFPKQIFSVSKTALIHFALVCLFVLIAPMRIIKLYNAFRKDIQYKDMTKITILSGWITFILSILWFVFFYYGIGNEYRGLWQKIIALITIYWIIRIMKRTASITPRIKL
jgi:hypothetical protein